VQLMIRGIVTQGDDGDIDMCLHVRAECSKRSSAGPTRSSGHRIDRKQRFGSCDAKEQRLNGACKCQVNRNPIAHHYKYSAQFPAQIILSNVAGTRAEGDTARQSHGCVGCRNRPSHQTRCGSEQQATIPISTMLLSLREAQRSRINCEVRTLPESRG